MQKLKIKHIVFIAIPILMMIGIATTIIITEPKSGEQVPGSYKNRLSRNQDSNINLHRKSRTDGDTKSILEMDNKGQILDNHKEPWEYPVNLAYVQTQLPDNLYWKYAAPTKDPEILAERKTYKERMNKEFGKIQANEASHAEIDKHYTHKQKVSEDYIQVLSYIMENYGDKVSARDRGLFKLGIDMHTEKLKQLPREIKSARVRKKAYDEKVRLWKESQDS